MENPSKNYPKAVFIGALITVIIFVLGTFALGVIIPAKRHQPDAEPAGRFRQLLQVYPCFLAVTYHSRCVGFGVLAGVLTWVAGPSKGIFAVGKAGYLPPFFQKTNKLGVQKNILYVQGL